MKINIDDNIQSSNDNVKVSINESEVEASYKETNKSLEAENNDLKEENFTTESNFETYKSELGKIIVYDKMDHINGVQVEDAQINLYKLSDINPRLVASVRTDSTGRAEFFNLENGSYRVIAIVDKRFFRRPEYYRWNEVCIEDSNKEDTVIVVNKLKPEYKSKVY